MHLAPNPHSSARLRRAAAGVRERLRETSGGLPGIAAILEEAEAVAKMVESALRDPGGAASPSPSPSGVRILDLLRSEVLKEWESPGMADDPSSLLQTMRAFEVTRARLDPEGSAALGSPVLDPWARALLREVAHTLGSSFGAMVMLTEILATGQSGEVNELQKSQLRMLYRAALTVGSSAGDMLRLAGPFEESEGGDPEQASVARLLANAGSMLAPILEDRQLTLKVRPPPEALRVERPLAVKRAIVGLGLAGAAALRSGTLTLAAKSTGAQVAVSILASGETRPADSPPVDTLFPPRPETNGFGFSLPALGIVSARRLLETMGSSLEIQVDPPSALEFSFSFPAVAHR